MKNSRLAIVLIALLAVLTASFISNHSLRILFPEKVWAHRVNSIGKLNEAKALFDGVELDLVFHSSQDKVYFDVTHPPDPSTGLSLSDYLRSNRENTSLHYWLDLKNLDLENGPPALVLLDSILSSLEMDKRRINLESTRPEALVMFNDGGYRTAYYLPTQLRTLDSKTLQSALSEINLNIDRYDNTYISSDYRDYSFLKKYFPHQKKLIWFTQYGSEPLLRTRFLLFRILLDRNVDVLLIPC